MVQESFDTLMTRTDSRYRLSMVAARHASQLKQGVPSTLTGEPLVRADNAVTVALKDSRWAAACVGATSCRAPKTSARRCSATVGKTRTWLRPTASRATRRGTTVTGLAAARAVALEALGGGKRIRA